ncbi:putative Zn-dependent protease [Actinomadura pelletieri DSM 43383]|uniref:Putative Zn-dependent protease n=1 Tax=Actinomadura pelletieri DSM 43383 TaxID=1120940 RepID=A0A495QA95_9ACTN|nr:metallopeptidase TldD-related protein [Actinomadura pelletieri]RKS68236.1 putative Zn-dependent protease [Actinomadura pelletieri DSM 43383]
MLIDKLASSYLAECSRRGIDGEIRVIEESREELVTRNGLIDSKGRADETVIGLTVAAGGHKAVLAAGVEADVATVVAEGHALVTRPGRGVDAPGGGEPPVAAARTVVTLSGRETLSLDAVLEDLVDASAALPDARECEVRAVQVRRTVHHFTPHVAQSFPTTHGSLVLRATMVGSDGRVSHVDRSESGPDVSWLLRRFEDRMLRDAHRQLSAPELAAEAALPSRVVLAGSVAAQLVCLLSEALSAEAVEQGSSRLASRLGASIGDELVTVVDDPLLGDGPRLLPFDDEGVRAAERVLIDAGRLRGFLGSRDYSSGVTGSALGNARRPDVMSPPRPGGSNLYIRPGTRELSLDEPTVRITQTHGMHLSNGITGEFSTGATATVHTDGQVHQVSGLSVTGNVLDLLRNVRGIGGVPSWCDDGESSFGAPDLLVTGLVVGR